MAEPSIAIAADIRRNRKMTALPSDQARYGWIVALGEAKTLRSSGTFSPGQWDEVMGRHARYRDAYIGVGLLHVTPSRCDCVSNRGDCPAGTLVVHDWHVYQREHAVRQARYMANRDAGSDVQSDVQSDAHSDVESDTPSRALSLSLSNVSVSNQDRVVDEVGESAIDAYYRLTTKPPRRTVIGWLDRLTADHADRVVCGVMAAEWKRDPNPADFLGRVQTRLASQASQATRKADDQRRRSAIDEQRELQKRLDAMSPEERARMEQRAAEVRANIGSLVKGMS